MKVCGKCKGSGMFLTQADDSLGLIGAEAVECSRCNGTGVTPGIGVVLEFHWRHVWVGAHLGERELSVCPVPMLTIRFFW